MCDVSGYRGNGRLGMKVVNVNVRQMSVVVAFFIVGGH